MLNESRTFSLTRAGRAYMRFLVAYNSNDAKQLAAFVKENFAKEFLKQTSAKDFVAWCQDAFKATGKLQIHKVYFSEEFYVIIVAIDGKKTLYLEKMKIASKSPHKIIEYFRENA